MGMDSTEQSMNLVCMGGKVRGGNVGFATFRSSDQAPPSNNLDDYEFCKSIPVAPPCLRGPRPCT